MTELAKCLRRNLHNYMMLRAVDKARRSVLMGSTTRTQGLRTIRDFQRVNGVVFDPWNKQHVSTVEGMAPYGAVCRKLRRWGEKK